MVGVCALLLRRVRIPSLHLQLLPLEIEELHSVTEECERAGRALLRVCSAGVSPLQRLLLPCCLVREVEELQKSVQVATTVRQNRQ